MSRITYHFRDSYCKTFGWLFTVLLVFLNISLELILKLEIHVYKHSIQREWKWHIKLTSLRRFIIYSTHEFVVR